jgi:hypothetical protein
MTNPKTADSLVADALKEIAAAGAKEAVVPLLGEALKNVKDEDCRRWIHVTLSMIHSNVEVAWDKAGAQFGWLGPDAFGRLRFRRGQKGEEGEVHALRFDPPRPWKGGALDKLPIPDEHFGFDLSDREVTDTGLQELAALKHLQMLNLSHTTTTDSGLKELAALKNLQKLDLTDTKTTDAGVKELAALKELQSLALDQTAVTDAGLRELAGFRQLHTLSLANTRVTDAGVKELASLPSLQVLDLRGTQVTDGGLKVLLGCRHLEKLQLSATKVTDLGVKELQKALPKCEILR